MKFKTWEKIYWAIIAFFFIASMIFALIQKGDIPVKVQGQYQLISKWAFIGYSLLGYLIIFVPIWLIVRLIVNSGDKEREREQISLYNLSNHNF